jgi:hypothetical protein
MVGLAVVVALAATAFGASLSDDEIETLYRIGLSPDTISALQELYQDNNRKRPPSMTVNEIRKMTNTGFPDDLIHLFIGLDWLTGHKDRMPLTPAQARKLAASGVSFQTIKVMAASEISEASKENPKMEGTGEGENPSAQSAALTTARVKPGWEVLTPDFVVHEPSQPKPGGIRLGREVYNTPNGKQIILYRSPFGEETKAKLGRQVLTKPNGKQIVVYYSTEDRDQAPQEAPAQEDRITTRDLVKSLRIQIDP